MIFQGLLVARKCLLKRGLLCNSAKKGRRFMGHSGTGLKFSITIEFSIVKTFFAQFFKNVKITYFGPKEKRHLFQILLHVESYAILASQGSKS